MSIPLHSPAFRLPDFRNQGIWLRLLLMANALLLGTALAANREIALLADEVTSLAAFVEPALLLILTLLYVLSGSLRRLPGRLGLLAAVALAMAVMAGADWLVARHFGGSASWRAPLAAGAGAALILAWLDLGMRARAPAIAEARLSALTARIRPHFLFNSLNAVLGVMRDDPRRAEVALEELAELFRALMRDNRELSPLSEEIALARKYVDIERLRLGERLRVSWEIADCPPDMLAPPLLLQPLLENAIHHGIEPAAEPGEIHVRIAAVHGGVAIEIDNPWHGAGESRHGNRMALENLRERLLLFYDLEARLATRIDAGRYVVRVDLPRRSGA